MLRRPPLARCFGGLRAALFVLVLLAHATAGCLLEDPGGPAEGPLPGIAAEFDPSAPADDPSRAEPDDAPIRFPASDDWVFVLGVDDEAGRQRLSDLAPDRRFAFEGRIFESRISLDSGLEVRPTDLVLAEVYRTYERESDELFDLELETSDGPQIISGTGEHPIWVEGLDDFAPLRDLQVGDVLRTPDGVLARVAGLRAREGDHRVFNFAVRDAHNYFVQSPDLGTASILVHNECGPKWGTEVDLEDPSISVREYGVDYSSSPSGNYDIEFSSGNYYHGKGGPDRAEASAIERALENDDTIVSVTHTRQPNAREAFKQEDRNIQASGGIGGDNYNKINSPGRKMRAEDGD